MVELTFEAALCPVDSVWLNGTCVHPLVLTPAVRVNVPVSSVSTLLQFDVQPFTGAFKLVSSVSGLKIMARSAAAPTESTVEASGMGGLQVASPRPARWFFTVSLASNTSSTADLTLQVTDCSSNVLAQGEDCATNVTNGEKKLTTVNVGVGRALTYFHVHVTHAAPLFVHAYTDAEVPLEIFASYGNLPTSVDTADIRGCTGRSCLVPVINLPASTVLPGHNESWYVAVTSNKNTSVSVWFHSLCAPGCDDHGTCEKDDEESGMCLCFADYSGIDCSAQDNTMSPPYMVLLVIASLVVASALVGFIVWIYLRRRRAQYDKI